MTEFQIYDLYIRTITVVIGFLQFIITIIGVVWVYFRFRKESPLHPRIEFDLNCKFFTPQKSSYLTAITISADNKGNVEHKFSDIRLRIRGIKDDQPLKEFERYAPMVDFPMEIMKGVNIVPAKYGYFFVRPNVNQIFNYTTQMPTNIRFIIIRATFKYQRTNEIHIAERVFEVRVEKD